MRIGIDGYNLAIPHGTGVATYGAVLADTLAGMGHQTEGLFGIDAGTKRDTREVLFFERLGQGHGLSQSALTRRVALATALDWCPARALPVPRSPHVDIRSFGARLPDFAALWTVPLLFDIAYARFQYLGLFTTVTMPDPPAVMHWTYPLPIRLRGARNIYTIHDLVPLRLPFATTDDKRYYHRLIGALARSGDTILTVSEASRADIAAMFPDAAAQTVNAWQASPPPHDLADADPADDAAFVKGLFGLERGGYFLFFGAMDPKKNLRRIVDAYLSANVRAPLVIVAARDWGMGEDAGLPDKEAGPIATRIRRLDYLPRAILFRLIRSARAVLFPSLLEGFGLPALEAMQLGTPVIASDTGSLPEVVGDAGLLVDPYRVGDIAAAIRALDGDADLRARLAGLGPEQAARFSVPAYAGRLGALYDSLSR